MSPELRASRYRRTFAASPESVSAARRFVVSTVRDLGVDEDAAALLTSELAANAVLHADSDFRVEIGQRDHVVRIGIVNDAPELLLMVREPSAEGGRGLHILQTVALDWGVENRPGVKIVWFELPVG